MYTIYRQILNSNTGDFNILINFPVFEENLGLISWCLQHDAGGMYGNYRGTGHGVILTFDRMKLLHNKFLTFQPITFIKERKKYIFSCYAATYLHYVMSKF